MPNFHLLVQGSATRAAAAPRAQANDAQLQREVQQTIEAADNAASDAARAGRAARSAPSPDIVIGSGGGITIHRGEGIATTQGGWNEPRDLPRGVIDISIAFFGMCAFIAVGWPLARAFGKRLERRTESSGVTPALAEQLQRIEQAVDTMSIEVERISESQRFLTKLQSGAASDRVPV